jgi:hypothetical protein
MRASIMGESTYRYVTLAIAIASLVVAILQYH